MNTKRVIESRPTKKMIGHNYTNNQIDKQYISGQLKLFINQYLYISDVFQFGVAFIMFMHIVKNIFSKLQVLNLLFLIYIQFVITKDQKSSQSSTVNFIPWPHLKVFDGFLEDGIWYAGNATSFFNPIVKPDNIQLHAMKEGLFFPLKEEFSKYHLFSTKEANLCIEGKTIYFFGDSYVRQMFIGFADILLNRPSNEEIRDGIVREEVVIQTGIELDEFLGKSATVKAMMDPCRHQDLQCVLDLIEEDESIQAADVLVGNILVHHMTLHLKESNYINKYMQNLKELFSQRERLKLTWVTGPSYAINRVPSQYRNATMSKPTELMNFKAIDLAKAIDEPLLDFFSLTHSCKWSNCSSDGGHRARFVNRMKAQMLLNNICYIK